MMNGTKLTRLSLSALACMLHVSVVHAQQTWFNGGTDDWDTTSLNWDGGSAAWSNVATNDAIFGTAGDTVTVAEPGIQVDQITFSADGYEIAGATPLTIHGTVAITTLGHTAIISAPIIGNNGFTTTGVADQANHVAPTQWSTLILSNPGNSYVGNTVIGSFASDTANAGALRIGTNEVIPDASNVFLTRKARFELGVHSETINNLFLRNQARVVLDNASTGALYVRHIKFLEHAFIDSGTGDGQMCSTETCDTACATAAATSQRSQANWFWAPTARPNTFSASVPGLT